MLAGAEGLDARTGLAVKRRTIHETLSRKGVFLILRREGGAYAEPCFRVIRARSYAENRLGMEPGRG